MAGIDSQARSPIRRVAIGVDVSPSMEALVGTRRAIDLATELVNLSSAALAVSAGGTTEAHVFTFAEQVAVESWWTDAAQLNPYTVPRLRPDSRIRPVLRHIDRAFDDLDLSSGGSALVVLLSDGEWTDSQDRDIPTPSRATIATLLLRGEVSEEALRAATDISDEVLVAADRETALNLIVALLEKTSDERAGAPTAGLPARSVRLLMDTAHIDVERMSREELAASNRPYFEAIATETTPGLAQLVEHAYLRANEPDTTPQFISAVAAFIAADEE